MTFDEERAWLIGYLIDEDPDYAGTGIPEDSGEQWQLLRSLMNVRPARPIGDDFLLHQDRFLQEAARRKGITDIRSLEPVSGNLYLWQGDITALRCDAIVDAANSGLTGCYHPCHNCIDNLIHTYAGVQLRLECAGIMERQGHKEAAGQAKITHGWNLPAAHVIHTVGPVVEGDAPAAEERRLLASCYRSCLSIADMNGLGSIAFCCISAGRFRFPGKEAALIAVSTVRDYLRETGSRIRVIFDVFSDKDREIYRRILAEG